MDEYLDRFQRQVLPMIADSAYVVNVAPGDEPDAKVCLELGAALLLDKPLFIVQLPGRTIPERLRRAADEVIEGDLNTEAGRAAITDRIIRFTEEHR